MPVTNVDNSVNDSVRMEDVASVDVDPEGTAAQASLFEAEGEAGTPAASRTAGGKGASKKKKAAAAEEAGEAPPEAEPKPAAASGGDGRRKTAAEMATKQREISVAEFFT